MNDSAPVFRIDRSKWLQAFRDITNATNERTAISTGLPLVGVTHHAPVINFENDSAISSALLLANLNSLPLDWSARLSVGGTSMNFFIVKQLPVLPPETYLEKFCTNSKSYVELVIPRVLELIYTAHDLVGFARDLGYGGDPFGWDEGRRHCLQSELDAIYAHMYRLSLDDLEWILDAPAPSSSFPGLKQDELKRFREYRTKRYVLTAFDKLSRGEPPDLGRECG